MDKNVRRLSQRLQRYAKYQKNSMAAVGRDPRSMIAVEDDWKPHIESTQAELIALAQAGNFDAQKACNRLSLNWQD